MRPRRFIPLLLAGTWLGLPATEPLGAVSGPPAPGPQIVEMSMLPWMFRSTAPPSAECPAIVALRQWLRRLPVTALAALGLGLLNAAGALLLLTWLRRQRHREAERVQRQLGELAERLKLLRQTSEPRAPVDVTPLALRLDRVEDRINGLSMEASGCPQPASEAVAELEAKVEVLQREVASLRTPLPAGTDAAAAIRTNWLTLEHEALGEAWQRFSEGSREVIAAAEAAMRDARWREVQGDLHRLALTVPADLRPTCVATLAPSREFFNLASKVSLAAKLAGGDLPSSGSEAKDLLRLRECATVLAMIQGSSLVAERLDFRLERWVAESFLPLADLILQRYQQAQQAGDTAALEESRGAALRFLKLADLLPVEIVLGHTPFDSARHIGRSTACRPDLPDGVIVGVLRNGFVRGGQQVVRQPEVVVNRLV